ncbi:MAG: enoyl-[acyl-carrier-protein] reductase FabK [Spirochaetes bacterium]|nr:enoyl-[acyl-carrier-protein] reductase FabK [Spirochaetota bacterium]
MNKDVFKDNSFCKMLGIEYPVIQGGMAWIADAGLAAAVSNAGGLGLIAAMSSNAEQLRAEIRKAQKLTDKPFGVNIMLMSPFADEVAQVVVEEGVKILTTGAGSPAKYMSAWLGAGIKVLPVVPSVAYAKKMQQSGAIAIIAEGCEAGGHIGELTTMALVPQVVDAVEIPVAAAGGIADGRGIAAAFMLGARAVQIGTRFLVARECNIHQNYKDLVIKAGDIETMVTGRRTGHPVRALKTEFSRSFVKIEADPNVSNDDIAKLGSGALRAAAVDGDKAKGSFMAGQIAGLVKKEQTCAEMISEMFNEFETVIKSVKL